MLNGKSMIIILIVGLIIFFINPAIKRIIIKMSQYFPTPSSHKENIKVEIDLSNYVTKKDINDITHLDTSNFALKTNLSSLKTEVDKLDIDKLATAPVDLSKLSKVYKK